MSNNFWYRLRQILGNANWAIFFILLGAREVGKSYSVTNFLVDQAVNKGIPFWWIRLTENQKKKLLANRAERLIDGDIVRKYGLRLSTSGDHVYNCKYETVVDSNGEEKEVIVEKKLIARVMDLSTFYSDKGSIFDKDFLSDPNMRYNIAIDEFQREKNEKKTFDIAYSLVNQLENILRSTKSRTKVFFMGNTLEEASDILAMFGFIPENFGIYKLVKNKKILVKYLAERDKCKTDHQRAIVDKKYENYDFGKRALIHYIPNSETYKLRRKGSIADILMPNSSTFTNKVNVSNALISKARLHTPSYIIKFTKDSNDWFTVWDSNIVCKYNGEKKPVVAMRPYLDERFSVEIQKNIIDLFDTRSLMFRNLITFKRFQSEMSLLKPRQG